MSYLDILLLQQHVRHDVFQLVQLGDDFFYFVKVADSVLFGRKELITDSMNILWVANYANNLLTGLI